MQAGLQPTYLFALLLVKHSLMQAGLLLSSMHAVDLVLHSVKHDNAAGLPLQSSMDAHASCWTAFAAFHS
eukprot:636551-Lingulodinium_polyedra.AAC.1